MAGEKFLFVGSDGYYAEDSAAIATSAGAGDADKLLKTNGSGKIDSSFLDFQTITRYFTADLATTVNITLSGKQTIDGTSTSTSDVLVKDQTSASENGIYTSGAGAWVRRADYDSAAEIEDGSAVAVGSGTANADKVFLQIEQVTTVNTDDVNFVNIGTNAVEAGDGISKSGNTLSADLKSSGGLKIDTGEIAVEPNDFAGEGLTDDGADNMAIDWSTAFNDAKAVKAEDLNSSTNGEGASIVGIEDSAGNFTATEVEAALAELAGRDTGPSYTAGTGGVTKGDLIFIDSNDTVLPYATISGAEFGIGLAASTESAAAAVLAAKDGTIMTGVLTTQTAGTKQYWDGSAITSTIPSGSGSYVWQVGVAKNANDLHVDVDFVKKNI